jgi:hypothetical protein
MWGAPNLTLLFFIAVSPKMLSVSDFMWMRGSARDRKLRREKA